jgi:hypothetical protein
MVETHNELIIGAPMATEQTPLLADHPNDVENDIPSSNGETAPGSVSIMKEPTNREIALIMSCIWVCIPPSPPSYNTL